jgi:hypothetical protein
MRSLIHNIGNHHLGANIMSNKAKKEYFKENRKRYFSFSKQQNNGKLFYRQPGIINLTLKE